MLGEEMIAAPYVACGLLIIIIAVISRKNVKQNAKMMSLSEKNFELENQIASMREEFQELGVDYALLSSDNINNELESETGYDTEDPSPADSSSNNTFDYKSYTRYQRRSTYMSCDEINFGNTIRQVIPDRYIMFPQINLATIIQKYNTSNKSEARFRNELFRNIDYGLFNRSTYELELLIELNDHTHNQPERKARDEKVNFICMSAGIKLITFWHDQDLSASNVQEKINTGINCDSAYLLQDILNS